MALGAALVDRARIVEVLGTGVRVQGRTPTEPVEGEWFKARLFLPAPTESPDTPGRRRKVVKRPQLLFGVKDVQGAVLVPPKADMKIEVDAPRIDDNGPLVFRVDGLPEVITKRRGRIGYLANLSRIEETQREDVT